MSDTANSFGGQAYQSQTTRALSSISESPAPDLSDGEQQFVSMLSRHDYQIKFLADNQQQLQVGVNQATSNPIQQIQQFIADIQVLLSGGLPKGALDFGDLQYELPAIGALLGFGTGGPVNLFQAAEKFFFGYVVPTQQYTDLQIAGFNSWASQLGIDPQFIKDMDAMTQAFGDLFNGLQNLGPSLESLFGELGISGTDLGPLGQALSAILKWFQPIDFSKFGTMIEWLTDAIDPWITSTTKTVNWINALIAAIGAGGDVVNSPLPDVTRPFSNLIKLFATLDFTDPQFKTLAGWATLFGNIFVNMQEFREGVWAAMGGATSISINAITDSQPNLLWNPDFEGSISIDPSTDWVWDSTTYYSADGIPGSARVTADGFAHGLRSNAVPLSGGQIVNLSVRVLTNGFACTGRPLRLDVVTFLGDVQVSVQTVDSLDAPTTAATDWFSSPTGARTALLHGTFTMPDDGSADNFKMHLGVDETATAGQVWFDDAVAALSGGLLADLRDDAQKGAVAFTQLWASISTAAQDYTDWPTFSAAFNTALQTYVTTMSGIQADEQVTIQEILNNLIPGLFPANQDLPTGIEDLRKEADASNDAWSTLWSSWGSILSQGGQSWSAVVTQMDAALQTYFDTTKQIDTAKSATLKQLISSLFHIDTDTGQTQSSGIEGLTDAFNQLGAALSGDVADAGDWAWLATIMSKWFGVSQAAHDIGVSNANTLGERNNAPLIYGLDDTTEANITFATSTDVITLKAPNSIIAFGRCAQTDDKNTIAFTGARAGATPPSGTYVTLYKVDFDNSRMVYITTTLFSSAQLNFASETWLFATAAATPVLPGDVLAVEFQSTDSTNVLNLWGSLTTKPAHPTAQLPALAATRNAGTSAPGANIALSALTFTNANVPYIGFEISNPPAPVYPAFPTTYTAPGTYTQVIDAWVNFVDLIPFGGGGGGQGETGFVVGRGGSPGIGVGRTLQRGVDFPTTGTTTLTITVGAGGAGGPYFTNGANGQDTTISWVDIHGATQTLTGAGGQGGGLGNNGNVTSWGQAANDVTLNGIKYQGGAAQLQTQPGNPPGGSGPGGQPFQYGFAGGRGQAEVVERQT